MLRERLRRAIGSPVLLAAAAGSHSSQAASGPHRHPKGQLLGSRRGLLTVSTEAEVWVVPAIHAVWLPPNHLHAVRPHGDFDGWSVYVAEEACHDLPRRPRILRVSGLLREAVLRAATWPDMALDPPRLRLARVILDEVATLPEEPFGLPMPRDPRLLRIAQALIEQPQERRRLEEWSDWAGISPRTLSRRFVQETGFNFTEWGQRARLMRSLEALAAGVSVTTVALDLGYSNISFFIALFRRCFGTTPHAYFQAGEAG